MKIRKSWELAAIAACVWIAGGCGDSTGNGTTGDQDGAQTTSTTSTSAGSDATTSSTSGAAGKTADETAGKTGASAGANAQSGSGATQATAAGTGGMSGTEQTAELPVAVATIEPFSSGSGMTSAGAAGASGSGAAGEGAAGSAAASATGLSGTATFTKTRAGVDLVIEVTGCEDGKSYPVHIHEGTSCESTMTQGGHWGAPQASAASAAGAGGAGTSAAAGTGGSTAGAAGSAAGSGADMPKLSYRGEGIPDIVCSGTMGTTSTSRSTPDVRLVWSLGNMSDTDVVGHVVVVHDGSARIACGKIELQQ